MGPMHRRRFLVNGLVVAAGISLGGDLGFGALKPAYTLAPENLLPDDIKRAAPEVREAYRFAIANRETLRYIPCYCGCAADGHTSNASCYIKDTAPTEKPVFDRMSLG